MLRGFESLTRNVKIPPCLCCGKELKNIDGADEKNINQPDNALTFDTQGHYGSAVFDPMNPTVRLEINICDECVEAKRDEGLILHVTKLPMSFTTPELYEQWNKFKHG